jgi:hypothetical protein
VYTPEEFEPGDNVGLHLVSSRDRDRSIKLVAVDFDAPEILPAAAAAFLPKTAGWGRASKPISQLLFVSPFERSLAHKDLCFEPDARDERARATLIEVRAEHQSMCPPSVHPNGERLAWLAEDITALVLEPKALRRGVDLLATYALIARYYNPRKARHFWGLYLAGFLHQLGLTLEECTAAVRLAGEHVRDPEVKDRLDAVRNTYAKPDDDPLAGAPRLAEEIGDKGKNFIASLRRIWGSGASDFITDDHGRKILSTSQQNVRRALAKLNVKLTHDTFADQQLISVDGQSVVPLDDTAITRLWLATDTRFGFRPPKDLFIDVMLDDARSHRFHPVRDYLASLSWDGVPRVETWLARYGSALDNEYTRAVGKLVLVAAVRRVRQPGCKFDELLVLESAQGWNKSTALRALCPKEEWFSDDLPLGLDAKQMIERTAGRWLIEVAELVGSKRETDHLKASLSRQVDGPVRMAYGRIPVAVPRQFVIIGTTNSGSYLKDMTGNRRFWPVRVKKFNVDGLTVDRDQLWAEAVALEENGASVRLDPRLYLFAASETEARRIEDAWEEPLAAFTEGLEGEKQRVGPQAVWSVLNVPLQQRDERASERVIAIMQRLGFSRVVVKEEKRSCRGWGRDLIEGIWRPPGWGKD